MIREVLRNTNSKNTKNQNTLLLNEEYKIKNMDKKIVKNIWKK